MSLSGRKKVRHFLHERRHRRIQKIKPVESVAGLEGEKEAVEFAPINFDKYKDQYQKEVQDSISFIGQKLDFFIEKKAQLLRSLAQKHVGDPAKLKALDVGCGIGITDQYLTAHFHKVYGVDLAKGLVQKAAQLNPRALYKAYNGRVLPYPDHSMDLTFAICVLHHVPPENWNGFARELVRVTRKGGLVVIMEHNPLNPLTNRAVNHCELDNDAILLRMAKTSRLISRRNIPIVEKRFILFTPFEGRFFGWVDKSLGWLPLGAQYYVAGKV